VQQRELTQSGVPKTTVFGTPATLTRFRALRAPPGRHPFLERSSARCRVPSGTRSSAATSRSEAPRLAAVPPATRRPASVQEPWLDTGGPVRELLIAIFSWIAEQERARLIERTNAGLDRAKRKGVRHSAHRARHPVRAKRHGNGLAVARPRGSYALLPVGTAFTRRCWTLATPPAYRCGRGPLSRIWNGPR
jgi:hypothetical protein